MKFFAKNIKFHNFLLVPIFVFLLFCFVSPFFYNFVNSFLIPTDAHKTFYYNYKRFFGDIYYLKILAQTLLFGAVITIITLIFGYPCAFLIAKSQKYKGFFVFMILAPLLTSIVIRSYGWILLLGTSGAVNKLLIWTRLINNPMNLLYNWFSVIIATVHVLLPFMILPISAALENIDKGIVESAMVLGATRWRTFWKIIFPLSLEGVATGVIIVFMLTIGSFVTILLLGGNKTMVLSILIYQQITLTFDNNFASTIGSILLLFSLIILYFQTKYIKTSRREIVET